MNAKTNVTVHPRMYERHSKKRWVAETNRANQRLSMSQVKTIGHNSTLSGQTKLRGQRLEKTRWLLLRYPSLRQTLTLSQNRIPTLVKMLRKMSHNQNSLVFTGTYISVIILFSRRPSTKSVKSAKPAPVNVRICRGEKEKIHEVSMLWSWSVWNCTSE